MKPPRILATTFLLTLPAFGVIETWDGGGADSNLSTAFNWLDNTAPVSDLVNTDIVFAGVVRLTPNLSAAFSADSVTFNNTAGAFAISGATLTVGSSGITNSDTDTQTFSNPISFGSVATSSIFATTGGLTFTNTIALPTTTLTVDGAGATSFRNFSGTKTLTKQGTGTMTWQPTVANNLTLVVSAGVLTTGADGTGDTLGSAGSIAVNGLSTFNIGENLTLDGSKITRASGASLILAAGKTLTLQNGGDVNLAGGFTQTNAATINVTGAGSTFTMTSGSDFRGGSMVNITAGGSVASASFLDLAFGGGNATVVVDGAGSSFGAVDGSFWGRSGNAAAVTFSNGSSGNFGEIQLASAGVGSATTVNVQSSSTLTTGALFLATTTNTATAVLTVDGASSLITQSGGSQMTIGAASGSTGTLTASNGGTFTSGTGITTVHATGTVTINGGTFNANGNLTLNGGQLTRSNAGTWNLVSDRALTVQAGGDAIISGLFHQPGRSNLQVTGSGSTFTTSGDFIWDGASSLLSLLSVNSGGLLSSGGALHLGRTNQAVALTVNGAGSQLVASPIFTSEWQAGVLLVNGADASLGGLRLADVNFGETSYGSLSVQSGSTASMGNLAVATAIASTTGSVEVTGVGSAITQTGAATFALGAAATSAATLTIGSGGTFTSGTGNIALNTTGTIQLDGGTLDLKGPLLRNGGVLNFNTGELRIVDQLTIGTGGLLGANLTLDGTRAVATTATTTIDAFRTLTLNGGSFFTGALVANGGIAFNSGTLAITGVGGFNIGTGALGSSVALGSGANLQVPHTTTVASGALLRVDGGGFSGSAIVNDGTLDHRDGVLNFTGTLTNNTAGRLFVGGLSSPAGAIANAGRITLQNGIGFLGGVGAITNTGIIAGDGTIAKPLSNNATGQLRAEAGKTLTFTGAIAENVGTFSLLGGTLEFTSAITNSALGFISGRGTLVTGGLTNSGVMAFSGGNTDVFGDVTQTTGARIVTSSAGAVTTFFDDVVHNGLEIFTGAGASTVFFGAQSGTGPFTGTGTVYAIGDLRPGASPASISFGGDLVLGTFARTVIEIGGTAPGTQHDRLSVADALHLGGVLEIQLINGFVPLAGQAFDVFDAASSTGNFSSVLLPALPLGRFWRTESLATQGVLYVGVVPATFGEFATAYGLTQGTTGDDDGDQITNAMEFLLGSNPVDPASLPYQSFTRHGQQSVYSFSLPELPPSAAKYAIKSSPDLQTWTTRATKSGLAPWSGGVASAPAANGCVILTFEETDSAPRRFYRLSAELE